MYDDSHEHDDYLTKREWGVEDRHISRRLDELDSRMREHQSNLRTVEDRLRSLENDIAQFIEKNKEAKHQLQVHGTELANISSRLERVASDLAKLKNDPYGHEGNMVKHG